MKKRSALVVTAALGLSGLVGCSSDSTSDMGMGDDKSTTTVAESSDFNQADVTFAQGMIPHHQQAVEMAELAETRAESAEVKELAAQIKGAQDPEIELMQGWLEEWGAEAPTDMGMRDGMMSEADMTKLEDASGVEFDEMFLTMMIEHHKGAIEQARTELDDGKSAEAQQLAKDIISAQEAEIETMQELLSTSS